MTDHTLLERTVAHVRKLLEGDGSGHDWWHIYRVWQTARRIALLEGADLRIVELAALLHDIADWKFHGGDESAGPRAADAWLLECGADAATREAVCDIIARVSFKGAGVATEMPSLEGKIVQDADRLDAIGAIGIGRAFAYGGHAGRLLYDPDFPVEMHASFAAYKNSKGPTLNHFYEKLFLLKDRMQTETGRQLAHARHAFMQDFVARFLAEWDGDV